MSLYTLTIDLLLKTGAFERDSGKAVRLTERNMARLTTAAKVAGAAIGTAIVAGTTATIAWTREVATLSREMDNFASVSKSTSVEFQRMAVGAETAGIGAEKLADQFKDFNEKVGEFLATGGGGMKDFFDQVAPKIGITKEAFRGLSGPQGLQLYFNSLEKAGLSQEKMSFYLESMASDTTALIPLLRNGGQGFNRWAQAAASAGAIIDGDTSKALARLRDVTTEAGLAFRGIKVQVAEGALPAMQDFADLVTDQGFKDGLTTITTGVIEATTGILGLASAAGNAYSKLQELVTLQMGGFGNAMGGEYLAAQRKELEAVNAELARRRSGAGVAGALAVRATTMPARLIGAQGIAGSSDAELRERAAKLRDQIEFNESVFGDPSKPHVYMSDVDVMPESFFRPKGIKDLTGGKPAGKSTNAAAEAMERYRQEAKLAAAVMEGPLAEAMAKHELRMEEINKLLSTHNIEQADASVLMVESATAYAKAMAEIEKAKAAPAALLSTMEREIQLLGIAGPARELYRRQMQDEADMREEINRAMEAGAKFSEDEIALLIARARAMAGVSMEMEEAARAAEDWQQVAVDAAGGVADTFADAFDGQIKNAKDFFSELKDVFKRGWWDVVRTALQQQFVNPIQKALQGMLSGQGFAAAGTGYAGLGSTIAGGILQGAQRAGIGGLGVGSTIGAAAGSIGGFGNNVAGFGGFQGQMYGFGGAAGAVGGAGSGFGMPPGMGLFGKSMLTGEFAGGLPYAGAGLGLLGAYYGLTQRGSGGMSSVLAGASYGALGLGVGGAIAGGLGAVGAGVGIGGIGAGAAAGATGAMGAIGAASWVPVVGWALAALAVVDKISGGKVFGTKYKTDSSQQTIDVSEAGGVASATAEQSRQKALFGGKKRRTIDVDPGQEARDAAAGMHEVLAAYAKQLGVTLRQEAATLVGGSFSQTYDRKGNITGSRSTVLGKTYDEDAETFQRRLAAEQAIAAVGKIDGQASRIAEDWRKSAELLEEGANFFVTAAVDARSGLDLWSGIGLSALTDYVERMQAADEQLAAAYSRLAGTAKSYGTLMADIATQVMTADLSGYQQQALNIERTYRQQVKAANDYAKALGLSGARAEDLAKIEELRALQMGKLQAQIEADKKNIKYGLSISDLSPLTDQEKLSEAMQALADATAKGDSQAAQQAAQAALGFGRNLYASGKDYNDLYGRVTSMIDGMKIGDLNLEDGTSMGQLADAIEALPEHFGKAIFEVAAGSKEAQQQTNAKLEEQSQILREQKELLQKLVAVTQGGVSVQKRESLNASLNAR